MDVQLTSCGLADFVRQVADGSDVGCGQGRSPFLDYLDSEGFDERLTCRGKLGQLRLLRPLNQTLVQRFNLRAHTFVRTVVDFLMSASHLSSELFQLRCELPQPVRIGNE